MRSATTYVLAAVVSAGCLAGAAVQDKPATAAMAVTWQKEIEVTGLRHLAVGLRAIIVAGSESGLAAGALDDGRVLWQSSKTTGVQPVTTGKLLAILTGDGLEVLEEETGQPAWRATLEAGDAPATVHATDQLILVVRGTEIRAWHLDGSAAWRSAVKSTPVTRIVAGPDSLVVGLQTSEIVTLDPATGTVQSSTPLPARPTAMTVAGDELFVPTANGELYAFRFSRGLKRMWRHRAVAAVGEAVVGERFVYFALIDNTLKAFGRKGGTQRWSSPLESRPISGPVLVGETLVVALSAGDLAQIPAATGAKPAAAAKLPNPKSTRMGAMAASRDGLYALVTGASGATTLVAWRVAPKPH